jgi:metal-responsive CopG/Arc/MetJ family transcriptional regulator
MKYKVSISVHENTLIKVRDSIREKLFKNRSEAFEKSFNHFMEEKNEQKRD